jgi:MFS family permease
LSVGERRRDPAGPAEAAAAASASDRGVSRAEGRERLPATVVGLGLVSLFTDLSSEAIFPLLPAFLVTLGASNSFIGVVEGAADLVANALKFFAGREADRRKRQKPLVLLGYGISTVARPLVAFATMPWHVLAVRVVDRVGKGVRTAPRDALIAAVSDQAMRGRAFGFHRAMDHLGAALGTVLALSLLWLFGARSPDAATADVMRSVFLWAAVPGLVAMITLAWTPELPHPAPPPTQLPREPGLPGPLRRALVPLTLFAFANATDAFLLVKAARLGAPPAAAPLLWLALHVIKASLGTAGGRLADRYGKRRALLVGWCVYAVTWGAIGFAGSLPSLFLLTALYGTSHGLVEGAERALVADLAGGRGRGAAFGAYNMVIGVASMLASAGFGLVWDRFGTAPAFVASACCAIAAAATLGWLVPSAPAPP